MMWRVGQSGSCFGIKQGVGTADLPAEGEAEGSREEDCTGRPFTGSREGFGGVTSVSLPALRL